MQQLNILLDDQTLALYRRYAETRGMTVEEAIRRALVAKAPLSPESWLEDCFRLMDQARGHSGGRRWRRQDLYDV